MKKLLVLLFIIVITNGCGGDHNQMIEENSLETQEGIIAQMDDEKNQILVIPTIKNEDLDNKTVSQIFDIALDKNGAYYYVGSDEFEELNVGTNILVHWNGTQEDSEIPQREAEKIDVMIE